MTKNFTLWLGVVVVIVLAAVALASGLQPVSARAVAVPSVVFTVDQGEGFRAIIANLRSEGLVRSSIAAEAFSVVSGTAPHLKAGSYQLNPSMSAVAILEELASGSGREVTVTIPEGKNIFEIDALLGDAHVIAPGALIAFHADGNLEGKLFPDTYRFFTDSPVADVVQKFLDNFNAKAAPLLAADPKHANDDLIVASLVQKEVPDAHDQAIVAGILWKRAAAGMPLQVDATLCYAWWVAEEGPGATSSTPGEPAHCSLDTKIVSAYNTYLNKGFPPAPIGNPGVTAITAALHPVSSPYWYYLSDPKTGKTIFAKTLDEQHQNTVKYLVND